jgi:hypothetical protein
MMMSDVCTTALRFAAVALAGFSRVYDGSTLKLFASLTTLRRDGSERGRVESQRQFDREGGKAAR